MKLTVYKASAGSGKTYTLAYEYLRLALSKIATDQTFRSILAVTFTNKATEEMKSRILGLLNLLAQGNAPESLAQDLRIAIGCTPKELQARALNLRGEILHGYSDFSILTIDRFFQRILQAFIREAGLRPGYAVELDSDRLLEDAVAKVLEDAGSDRTLRSWLLSLVEDNINAGRSWDISPSLRVLGYEIFKEAYLYLDDKARGTLEDKQLLENYIEKIKTLKVAFESSMKAIASKAHAHLTESGLSVDDFKNKQSGVVGYLLKLGKSDDYTPGKRALAALGNPDEWASKTSARSMEVRAVYHLLNPLLEEAITRWQQSGVLYNTATILLKNFKLIGLLADMARNIRLIAGEENLLPISDSVYLLGKLIGDSDAPFIYEKAGNRFHHFMMDEFQDTSTGQWQNFRPLLHNSLSAGNFNMVVGDVKQSIYRWRSGDWKILGSQLATDFAIYGISEQQLDANWRSNGVVVHYNNELFTKLSSGLQRAVNDEMQQVNIDTEKQAALQNMLTNAYSAIKQQVARTATLNEGFVSLEVIENTESKKSIEQALERIPQLIIDLQDRGYQPADIAILVRRGIEGQAVADTLLSYKQTSGNTTHCFDVISQDSLFLANAPVVKLAISILRLAINAGDRISETYLALSLASKRKGEGLDDNLHKQLAHGLNDVDKEFIKSLSFNSIAESFEQLVQYFRLNSRAEDLPFLQELHDVILKFSSDKLSDIASFIRWWDEKASEKKVLAANDKQNAIKILTIHKSKGLQFKAVIVPFCTWSMVPKTNTILWLQPQVAPFSDMPHLPVSYSSALAETIFYQDYFSEKTQSYVDNLNLLYVAFTRAEEELYAMVPLPERNQQETVASLLAEVVSSAGKEHTPFPFGDTTGERSGQTLSFGSKRVKECVGSDEKNRHSEISITSYPSSHIQSKLRIKYEAQGFFGSEEEAMNPRAYGTLMHRVFSSISTLSDADTAIDGLIADGLIEADEKGLYEAKLAKALAFPAAREWFSDSWEVRAEASFILPNSGTQGVSINRPDRVIVKDGAARVIDYKFGAIERSSYRLQVYSYMQGLQKMGYTDVRGYIWYVDMEKSEEVNL